jgi:nucleoside-diphosphate-sugar epimerase
MEKIVITGSEGLIGSQLKKHFENRYEVLCLDISLGNDLTDKNFVKQSFKGYY